MSKISKTKWAYVAGILDGEGSISISATTLHTSSGNPYKGYDLKVMISNTDMGLMEWLKETFGGNYREGKQNSAIKQNKICYRWTLGSYKLMEKFLLGVLPYMLMKREQANLALQYIRMDGIKNPAKREELHRKCISLNSGTPESPTTNTSDTLISEVKIESELMGNHESAPVVKQGVINPLSGLTL